MVVELQIALGLYILVGFLMAEFGMTKLHKYVPLPDRLVATIFYSGALVGWPIIMLLAYLKKKGIV